ncbi:MAG: SCO family protein [Pseudobdellovibrionaceae bacterium]
MTSTEQARELKNVGITEHLGDNLDLNLQFKNEKGELVRLGSYYNGVNPVVVSLVYYSCPGLCSFHLNGVVDSIKNLDWSIGKEYQYVVISFDAKETSELASQKKENYLKLYKRPEAASGWHFLTADAETIQKITSQIGFQFEWKEETKEWAHASAAVVTTPKGKISRYLHGIIFDDKTFRLALNEAGEGKIGNFVDRMIWYCFHYDPKQSKYVIYAANVMKAGGFGIIFALVAVMLPFWIRSRREQT